MIPHADCGAGAPAGDAGGAAAAGTRHPGHRVGERLWWVHQKPWQHARAGSEGSKRGRHAVLNTPESANSALARTLQCSGCTHPHLVDVCPAPKQGEWLPRLKEIVAQVSETFSQNFTVRAACAPCCVCCACASCCLCCKCAVEVPVRCHGTAARPSRAPQVHLHRCCSGPGALQAGLSSLIMLRPLCLQSVGCAGEVVLHEAPGEDYEKYAIEIRSVLSYVFLVEMMSADLGRLGQRMQAADEACCACCANCKRFVPCGRPPLSSSGTARSCRHLRMPQSRRPGRLFASYNQCRLPDPTAGSSSETARSCRRWMPTGRAAASARCPPSCT